MIHSTLNLGCGRATVEEIFESITKSTRDHVVAADVLVVDEMSMLSKFMLVKVRIKNLTKTRL